MTISTVGFSAPAFSFNAAATASADAVDGEGKKLDTASEEKKISGDISDHLSVSAKRLLKRLAELQEQLRDLRARMQSAENAAYSNLAAKNSVVASFQSQITAVTGSIMLMSASLFKELDRSGGMDITV
jgi:predicted  nucleic acid-binding Zn-ribbon protein